jgi:hypothetical protein
MTPQSPQAASQDLAEPVSGNSEFEDAWAQGFKFLRFPPALEVRYRQDKEADRLRLIRIGHRCDDLHPARDGLDHGA